jgi:quercetin dioxygenase-like cupin family protein
MTSGDVAALPADEPYPGVIRRTFDGEGATVSIYEFAPGATFPLHAHPQEQITLVDAGTVEMRIGDDTHRWAAGAWSVVPGDVPHGITAGPRGARITAIVTPRRRSRDAYREV